MAQELENIISQLEQYIRKAHQFGNKYDFIDPAYELCGALEELDNGLDTVEAILMLIERSPDIDYGGPGPLGSFMESFYRKGYEEKLVGSLQRKPTRCTIHLLERMINDPDDPHQSLYLTLMMSIASDKAYPESIQNEARENLSYLVSNLYAPTQLLKTQLAMAQQLLDGIAGSRAEGQQALQATLPPMGTVNYQGIQFKVINRAAAATLLPHITDLPGLEKLYDISDEWRFPAYYDNGFFLLAEEHVEVPQLELDYSVPGTDEITILGFIFLKDLQVRSHILAFDTDNSPVLIVLGNVQCPVIHLFGNIHYLGGHVKTDLLWAKYNHGELYINGSLDAQVVLADDMQVFIRKLDTVQALISQMGMNIYVKSAYGNDWPQRAATHDPEDVFLPALLITGSDGDKAVADLAVEQLKLGKPLLLAQFKGRD